MLVSEEDWQAIQETLFLSSIPGMRKSIHDAMAEPLSRSARKPRLVSWLPVHSKQALKDAKKLEAAGLEPRAEELLDILKNDPLQNPPAFEKLAGANPRWLGAMGAFTLVLHTWTQDLRRHIHVHALMACGGLDADGRWCTPKRSPTFLFPVHALSSVFRGRFLDALRRASQAGELPRDSADTDLLRQARLKELTRNDWVVYAKTPLAGPEVVLDYLSRYTHRVAVSNERIVGIDAKGVRLRVRADDRGGKRTTLIDGQTFIARFLQHVLQGPRRGPFVAPGLQTHPPLWDAQCGNQDRAADQGARGPGHAGGERAGA